MPKLVLVPNFGTTRHRRVGHDSNERTQRYLATPKGDYEIGHGTDVTVTSQNVKKWHCLKSCPSRVECVTKGLGMKKCFKYCEKVVEKIDIWYQMWFRRCAPICEI